MFYNQRKEAGFADNLGRVLQRPDRESVTPKRSGLYRSQGGPPHREGALRVATHPVQMRERPDAEFVDEQVLDSQRRPSVQVNTDTGVCPLPGARFPRASPQGSAVHGALRLEGQRPSLGRVDTNGDRFIWEACPTDSAQTRAVQGRCYRAHLLCRSRAGSRDRRL